MGDEDSPAERIAVALVRAQELGIELPPTIANFSSCQPAAGRKILLSFELLEIL